MIHSILFLCTGNSCRSQIAEGLARASLPPSVDVYSAGSRPLGRVSPEALAVLQEVGIDGAALWSKGLSDVPAEIDLVVTVCDHAAESCPTLRGTVETLHWSIPDPYGGPADSFRHVREMLRERIERELIPRLSNRSRAHL
ncbi:MAG: arsenate reductase ArsC [Deltaproteobacteria bacterium]|nr:arsenate reductase ArsC [Deltaproteobacteria bacterium]